MQRDLERDDMIPVAPVYPASVNGALCLPRALMDFRASSSPYRFAGLKEPWKFTGSEDAAPLEQAARARILLADHGLSRVERLVELTTDAIFMASSLRQRTYRVQHVEVAFILLLVDRRALSASCSGGRSPRPPTHCTEDRNSPHN
jgi:hypothetical protein